MANAAPYIASPLKRLAAGAMDVAVCGLCALVVVAIGMESGVVGSFTNARFFGVAVIVYGLYHFAFFLLFEGATAGQRTLDIQVARVEGGPLTVVEALVRSTLRPGLLWLLGALDPFHGRAVPVEAVISAILLLEIGMMFTLPSRQTLADLAARTLVVNVPPPQPHRAPAAPMYSRSDAEFGLPPD